MNTSPPSDSGRDCWNRIGVRGDRSCELLTQHVHCRHCSVYQDAAGQTMEREIPADYRHEWAQRYALQEQTAQRADQAAIVFRIGVEWLALPAPDTVTIAEPALPHRLPHRGGALLGIVNVRGRLYPCVSLGTLLRIDADEAPAAADHRVYPRLLVIQLAQQAFALPVQELHGIERYRTEDLDSPPTGAGDKRARCLTGVLSRNGMRIGCLDAELVGYKLAEALK